MSLDHVRSHCVMVFRKSPPLATLGLVSETTRRVRDLIADLGTSQADFAEAVGLDPSKMSKSLSGARRFSSLDLARIAEYANVTVDWLLTGEEPPFALAARAHAGSSSGTAIAVARRKAELRESAARLGHTQAWNIPQFALPTGKAYDQGEVLAAQVRDHLAAIGASEDVLDLPAAIEASFGIDVCLADLGDGFDGLAVATEHARMILASVTPNAYRQRFTIAHELAHILVADSQDIHLDEDVYGARTKTDTSEIRANAFAAALLMPRDLLLNEVKPGFTRDDFARLSSRLQVSPSALGFRMAGLQLIDEMTARQWGKTTAVQATQKAGAGSILSAAIQQSAVSRPPGLLARDLMDAYLEGKTTLRLYADLVGVNTETLRATLEQSSLWEL